MDRCDTVCWFSGGIFFSLTGVELHQWIGILGGLLALYHLLAHWDWVSAVTQRFFGNAAATMRDKFGMDSILLLGFALILVTGLVISTWLDLSIRDNNGWLKVHILASICTLLALLIKLALHWRWISRSARDTLLFPNYTPIKPIVLQPVPVVKHSMDRRDFLKVMGVVGTGTLLAFIIATQGLTSLQSEVTSTTSQTSEADSTASYFTQSGITQSPATNISTDGSCIQCGERCSYPGHCRRYTDTNNNNHCDYGECI